MTGDELHAVAEGLNLTTMTITIELMSRLLGGLHGNRMSNEEQVGVQWLTEYIAFTETLKTDVATWLGAADLDAVTMTEIFLFVREREKPWFEAHGGLPPHLRPTMWERLLGEEASEPALPGVEVP